MIFYRWAHRWRVPPDAVAELVAELGAVTNPQGGAGDGSEAAVQASARLMASRSGGRLWRNNVGAATMADGSFIRYGLANDSKAMNQQIKSSDLVGLRPVLIGPEDVGQIVGQFVARECKAPGWKYTGTLRERAQLEFLLLVASLGGDASFIDKVVN